MTKKDPMVRFWENIEPEPNTGCWLWSGWYWGDYGGIYANRRTWSAHRWGYTNLVGPIPDGMELDHKCRVKICVNPSHLEIVSHLENIRRAAPFIRRKKALVCKRRGHEYTPENSLKNGKPGTKRCRACLHEQRKARKK